VPQLSRTPGAIRHSGGRVGRDTADVLRDVLGMDAAAIAALEREGVVSSKPAAKAE
jgi:hypothetical protein